MLTKRYPKAMGVSSPCTCDIGAIKKHRPCANKKDSESDAFRFAFSNAGVVMVQLHGREYSARTHTSSRGALHFSL